MLLINVEVSWSRLQGDECRCIYQSRVLITKPRIKLLDNVVYQLVIGTHFPENSLWFQVVSLRALAIASLDTWTSLYALGT